MSTQATLSIIALLVALAWLVLRAAAWRSGDGGGTDDGGGACHVGDGGSCGGDGGGGD